ncbi:hypothetical protein Zmor_011087 [Zophobas morio]|uniref:MADF domain-containing protein n=1 Tax=Zophobas morio TaxID=2755281 RepID=A0AA38IT22_9CUCU|nr:hypothetical protein Zmor_011087 [Zophobas morio]
MNTSHMRTLTWTKNATATRDARLCWFGSGMSDHEYIAKSSDELLIDLVREYKHLYDHSRKDYKDKTKQENSWEEISTILHIPVQECKQRWKVLRDRYSKELRLRKGKTGDGKKEKKAWPLFEAMCFINDHLRKRRTFGNVETETINVINDDGQSCSSTFSGISHEETIEISNGEMVDNMCESLVEFAEELSQEKVL